jgi:hypothetical protein
VRGAPQKDVGVLESAKEKDLRRIAQEAREVPAGERFAHRSARRTANEGIAAQSRGADVGELVEFTCECTDPDCERSVKVPLYVYRRLLEAGDQYLLQRGHHASERYQTIITFGLVRIEQEID